MIAAALTLLTLDVSGQKAVIRGQVKDSITHEPLFQANVILTHLSPQLTFARVTDEKGCFYFNNVEYGTYTIRISFMGYQTYLGSIDLADPDGEALEIYLPKEAIDLEEIDVIGKKPIYTLKGDTLQFNAVDFKTNTGAVAEDLIRKLPGMVIENGTITAMGEEITRVLVDGKPFFGNDPMIALKNLPAEAIEKIELYDEKSEQAKLTGFDDGQSVRAINIVTYQAYRRSRFGRINGGYGHKDKYSVGGDIHSFRGDQRWSCIGLSNNVNQMNFAMQDMMGLMGSSGGKGDPAQHSSPDAAPGGGPPGEVNIGGAAPGMGMTGEPGGISTAHSLGVNFSAVPGDKLDITGSYFMNITDNNTDQELRRQYFTAPGHSNTYEEISHLDAFNQNHRLNMRLAYTIDSNNTLIYVPTFSYQGYKASSVSSYQNIFDSCPAAGSLSTDTSNYQGFTLWNELIYMHRFAKTGSSVSINASAGIKGKKGTNSLQTNDLFVSDSILIPDSVDQQQNDNTQGLNTSARIVYMEPFGRRFQLQLNEQTSFQSNYADRQTYHRDPETWKYDQLDSSYSSEYRNGYLTQSAGSGLLFRSSGLFLMAGLDYQYSNLISEPIFPAEEPKRHSFSSILPQVRMHYHFSSYQDFQFIYQSGSSPPSVEQMQNVVDKTNSLQLTMGNENLRQQFQHQIRVRYHSRSRSGTSFYMLMVSLNSTRNYITDNVITARSDTLINSSVLLKAGSQLVVPVNMNGYRTARASSVISLPLGFISSNLGIQLSYDYSHIPIMIDSKANLTRNYSGETGLSVSSNVGEYLDFMIMSRSSINITLNDVPQSVNESYFRQTTHVQFYWKFWKGFFILTSLFHEIDHGLSEGYDQSTLDCDLSLGKNLFKNQQGEIRLSVYNLFDQSSQVQRSVTESYIEDNRTDSLGRYIMLNFSYRFVRFLIKG
jgi:hypothetical protein